MTNIAATVFRNLSTDLRDAVEDAYEETPRAPKLPSVHIVHGTPPHDCEGVWISYEVAQRLLIGTDRCAVVPQVRFRIEIARDCYPKNPSKPDHAAAEKAALELMDDATTLWYGITTRHQSVGLFPSFPMIDCESVLFEDMRPREPQGGFAGWFWRLTVNLTGRPVA